MLEARRMRSGALIGVILAIGTGACADNGSPAAPAAPTAPTAPNLNGALLIATDGVMAVATSEARAFFSELSPSFSEPREELQLSQDGPVLSGWVSLVGVIRGGDVLDPERGYLGSRSFTGTPPIEVDGSIAPLSDGGCPCTVRLSGNNSNVSYSLSGTVDADGNRITSQVELRSITSFFPPQIGPSTYERR